MTLGHGTEWHVFGAPCVPSTYPTTDQQTSRTAKCASPVQVAGGTVRLARTPTPRQVHRGSRHRKVPYHGRTARPASDDIGAADADAPDDPVYVDVPRRRRNDRELSHLWVAGPQQSRHGVRAR